MTPPASGELRELLARRTEAAVEAAHHNGGAVPQPELDALDRLARLLELRDRVAPAPPPRPWAFAIILVVTLGILSALLFVRTGTTAIELEVDATQVAFTLPSEQMLFHDLELTSLGAAGLASITLPPAVIAAFGGATLGDPPAPMVLTVAEAGGRRGAIGIGQIRAKGQAQVDLRLIDEAGQYRLSISGAQTTIAVGVRGPIRVEAAGLGETQVDFVAPKGIELEPAASTFHLDFTFRDPARAAMTPQVPVLRPAFRRIEEFGERQLSILRTLSTILGGTLYFESLGGTTRKLRAGEILRMQEAIGEIRTLRLQPVHLSLSFHGNVSGMTSGDDEQRRSLMPTWLDLLRAQHGLGLLWGSTLYVAGVAFGVLRWWKGTL